jgi:tetratricopeptide (TPR) repeat protein
MICEAIVNRTPVAVVRLNQDVPPKLEDIINKALEKDRNLRYQHSADMRTDLQRLKRDTEMGRALAASSGTVAVAQESGAQVAQPPSPISGSSPALAPSPLSSAVKVAEVPVAGRKLWKVLVPAAVILIAVVIAGAFYFRSRSTKPATKLTEKDTIVLADFTNETGDPVFDDTLKTALSVSLNQSPFLNVLSDSNVAKTLKLMTRPRDTKLTPDIARELCQRAGSKAYIAGSIASLGSQYVLGLKVVNCQSGDALAQEQATAASKEKVLDTLGETASKLRGELGESLATVQKLDVPLSEATTSSLEALQVFSLGRKAEREKGPAAGLPYRQRAIELDPNFATGYDAIAEDYGSLGEPGRARDYFTKAFELREHASEREKLEIEIDYYGNVTGELEKALQAQQALIANYPRVGGVGLGTLYNEEGQYERAEEAYRDAVQKMPDYSNPYWGLANVLLALQKFAEAQRMIEQAHARKLDNVGLREALYAIAFNRGDSTLMEEEQQWFKGKPEENMGFSVASDTEAYAGHLSKARELMKQSVDSAIRADSKETGAISLEDSALREAAFGNLSDAKQAAADGMKLYPTSQGVEVEATLAYAIAGDTARAESLAQDLNKRYPLDTQMQSLWLPAIQAQLALDKKNPASALTALQATVPPIELGQILFVNNISCLYPTYIRGEAYMAAGQGTQAAAEFQKIIDHNGIVWNCWTGALAHLGVARANALHSRTSQGADADAARVRALAAYKVFLTLWKDADPDIPILKEAKAEYGKLQ